MTPRYIDANEALSLRIDDNTGDKFALGWNRAIAKVTTEIPKADVAPIVHGHFVRWYTTEENRVSVTYTPHCKCSECEWILSPYDNINFCPHCGAKMDEE